VPWVRIDGDELRVEDARIVWTPAVSANAEGIAFWLRASGGRTVMHVAGWAPGASAADLDGQDVRIESPGPDAGVDGRFVSAARIRFGRVTSERAVVSIDGEVEALDPADDARAVFEADLVCEVRPQAERDHCLGCGGPLDRFAEARDEFVAGFRITQRVLPVLCPACAGAVDRPRFCPTCGQAFADDAVSTHGEEGRVGYTARCPQGHVFSGALPG
jgi:hypothetical protein